MLYALPSAKRGKYKMHRPDLLEPLLDLGFKRQDTIFSGGKTANNKLHLDDETLEKDNWLKEQVVQTLGKIALEFQPDFIAGIPKGASKLGIRVAKEVSRHSEHIVKPVALRKKEYGDLKFFDYESQHDFNTVLACQRGIIVDDISNEFTNTRKVLSIPGLRQKTVAVLSIFHRGPAEARESLEVPSLSVVEHYIPPQLEQDSLLWVHAR
jgi:hypothetical protein